MIAFRLASILVLFLVAQTAIAQEGKPIFEYDFERVESPENKDEPGNGWKTNGEKLAAGNNKSTFCRNQMQHFRKI